MKYLFIILLAISLDPLNAEPTETETSPMSLLQTSLAEEQTHAQIWYYGWLGFNGALTAASLYQAGASRDPIVRATQRVSAAQSLLGTVGMLLTPIPTTHASTTLKEMPEVTPEDQTARVKAAEDFLKESSEAEEFGTSWVAHALSFGVAGAGAAAIRYGYAGTIRKAGGSPTQEATANFWSTLIVGEIQVFTQPTGSIDRWREYKQKFGPKSFNLQQSNMMLVMRPMNGGLQAGIGFYF